ncbi:DinB family protein [Blastococcus xanthinilyticus]|nr:DinB family protein [Blastococcus xanthinilyticus]
MTDARTSLRSYLQQGRDTLLWKMDGLSEYDVRRPLTPTGTNLLGLVKHLTFVELGYFGPVFGRPAPGIEAWFDEDAGPNSDMWATSAERRADLVAGYRAAWARSDATIAALALDAAGRVPWWGDGGADVTLNRVIVHVIAETHRHAGHADIVRELIDGSVGFDSVGDNLPEQDDRWWREYRDRLEQVARQAAGPEHPEPGEQPRG